MVGASGLPGRVGETEHQVPGPGTGHLTGTGFTGSRCDRYMLRVHWLLDQ